MNPTATVISRLRFRHGLIARIEIAIFGLSVVILGSFPCGAEDSATFLREESEVLLAARPGNWEKVFLRRTLHNSQVTGYRWELHVGDRDRRGQGAFTRTIECLLHAPADSVQVAVASPEELNLNFSFQGVSRESEMRVRVVQDESSSTITFEGRGELFEEFMERLDSIRKSGVEPAEDWLWGIMIEPGED